MPAENLFEGLEMSPEYLAELEASRVRSTGNTEQPELAEIKRNTAQWSEQDFGAFNAEGADLTRRMLALLRDGVAPDDAETFAVVDDDLALQRKLWSPDKASYIALARALEEPSELRSHYYAQDPAWSATCVKRCWPTPTVGCSDEGQPRALHHWLRGQPWLRTLNWSTPSSRLERWPAAG
jgi:hypothetical protein